MCGSHAGIITRRTPLRTQKPRIAKNSFLSISALLHEPKLARPRPIHVWRKFCERSGLHARQAPCCLRKAFLRSHTRARVPRRFGQAPVRSASASYGKSVRPPALDPRRAEIRRALRWHAREAACGFRKAFLRSTRDGFSAVRASCRVRVGSRRGDGLVESVSGRACTHTRRRSSPTG